MVESLEGRLKAKLDSGEITEAEYRELYSKFKRLGLLEPESKVLKSLTVNGRKIYQEGLTVNGPVLVAGILRVSGDLSCERLGIAGSGHISGEVRVGGKVSINGKLDVGRALKSGGECTITGKCYCGGSVYSVGRMTIAGKLTLQDELVCGNQLKVLGKVKAGVLECTKDIVILGSVKVNGDMTAERISCPRGGDSIIKGDVKGKEIRIGWQRRDDFGELVTKLVRSFMGISTEPWFRVKGSIKGELIELDGVKVEGDIIGDSIKLGENVSVEGKIYYSTSIETPKVLEERCEKKGK